VLTNAPMYDLSDQTGMESDVFVECPKCHSESARYVNDKVDVTLRCLCGYNKVVATKLQEVTIEHIDSAEDVMLPRQGTKLWNCLATLFGIQPENSQGITDSLNDQLEEGSKLTVSEVSSQLTVLRYKGLVTALDDKKGHVGGSTWRLTDVAKRKFEA